METVSDKVLFYLGKTIVRDVKVPFKKLLVGVGDSIPITMTRVERVGGAKRSSSVSETVVGSGRLLRVEAIHGGEYDGGSRLHVLIVSLNADGHEYKHGEQNGR